MTSATFTSTNSFAATTSARSATFAQTLASEWVKLTSLRSTRLSLGLGFLLSVATTAVAAGALGITQDDWSPDFNPTTTSMVGTIFGLIIYTAFGVMAVSQEYASGAIRVTLTATPNRTRVFFAKLIVVFATVLALGLATTIGMFVAGQAMLGAYGMPTADPTDPDVLRMVLGLGVAMPFFPLIGLAFGFLLRSAAGGITAALGLLWLPQILGQVVPMWFRENVLNLLPSNGVDSITAGHIQNSPAFSDPATGALIAGTWLVTIVAAAYIAFLRRDV